MPTRNRQGEKSARVAGPPPASGKAKRQPRLSMAVQLSTRCMNGQGLETRRIELVGTPQPPRCRKRDPAGPAHARESAARQLARGVRPDRVARLLTAMAHPKRIQILLKLLGGEATHKLLARTTGLKPGPLYHHLRELRMAELIGPKVRDLYVLTPAGSRAILAAIAMERLGR